MKKILIYFLICIFVLCIPFGGIIIAVYATPDFYENSYSRVFEDQYNYLKEVEGKKIVIVGTSSSSYGIIGEEMEKEFKMPVVILGLYGAIGNTYLLDISEKYINEGDIVVYMYDIYEASMHVGFNGEIYLQAFYRNWDIFSKLNTSQQCKVLAALPEFVQDNITFDEEYGANSYEGIYSRSAFNEKGHIVYRYPNNTMENGYDLREMSEINASIIDTEFTDYVRNWANKLRKKSVNVYYGYTPINELSRNVTSTDDNLIAFMSAWEEGIGMKPINSILDCYLDYRYFANENYHLNYSGAQYFTSYIINSLERTIYGHSDYEIVVPTPPKAEKV